MPKATRDDHHDWDYTGKDKVEEENKAVLTDPQYQITIDFYNHLFQNNPQMREIFWRFNLWQTMDKIVHVMNPQLDLNESLKGLSERHRGRGILNDDYNKIRISFRHALSRTNSTHQVSLPTIDAWVAAWDVFAYAMKVPDFTVPESTSKEEDAHPNLRTSIEALSIKENTYTLDDIAKHNTPESLWLIINGGVYDMTKFFPQHPGGDMMLLGAGRDATKLFNDNFHSVRAKTILSEYRIGSVVNL